jgi:choline monooxygenase
MNVSRVAEAPGTPLAQAHALAVRFYTDPQCLARERELVFGRSWQLAAHRGELADPGDHVVTEIAGRPILILRHPDGALRAFHNVCRHRAGPLAWCSGHGARALTCKYHGWTYTLDGQLRSAPEMQGASGFDPAGIRLHDVRVHEWQGLVFVALSDRVAEFDTVYAGITERIQPVDLAAFRFLRRVSYEVACHWKVYVDNFLEGYHLPHVHPGLSRILDYRAYDIELFPWYSLQHSPLRNNDGIYGDGEAWYYFVYPNVMLNVMPGRLQSNRVLPLGADRCRVEFDYYYADDPAVLGRIDNDQRFSDEIQAEDIRICEAVQRGLASGVYEAGRLCPRREGGVWHFHELLRAAYAADVGDAR